MENNNTYFILQHNKNDKIFRASFQTKQKKNHKNFVTTSHMVKKTRKKKVTTCNKKMLSTPLMYAIQRNLVSFFLQRDT